MEVPMRTEFGRCVAIVAVTGLAIGALVFPTQAVPQNAGEWDYFNGDNWE